MKELTTKQKGILTEEFIKLWFLRKGFSVSVPIGDNVVIGAGSVVVKDIPSNSVAVGNPCKVIKTLSQ